MEGCWQVYWYLQEAFPFSLNCGWRSRSALSPLSCHFVFQLIKFVGHVSSSQVHHYLTCAKVFVLNSSYEGLPHVVLEAFAAYTPVVATSVGGTPEIITSGTNGLLAITSMNLKHIFFVFTVDLSKTLLQMRRSSSFHYIFSISYVLRLWAPFSVLSR